ncbi:hypothetical protein [Salibacterium sp. K-3]
MATGQKAESVNQAVQRLKIRFNDAFSSIFPIFVVMMVVTPIHRLFMAGFPFMCFNVFRNELRLRTGMDGFI